MSKTPRGLVVVSLCALVAVGSGARAATYYDTVMADSPVSYWRLGEAAGATANDAAGGNNGTYVNVYQAARRRAVL